MTVIRPAVAADLPGIAAIYDREVEVGIATFDTAPPPAGYWQARLASTEPGDHLLVAEDDGLVVGFAYSGAYRPRAAYGRTREVSVYLAPAAAGQGLGRRMYDDLLARLAADDVHAVVALVARPNPASEALHRATGFELVGVLREVGHKHGRWIDTGWWQRLL